MVKSPAIARIARRVLLLALLCGGGQAPAAEPPPADLRILIDVSGSMKKNDPKNLRIPALKLLTDLIPKGAQAGVWIFAEGVRPLVPYGEVDGKWQQRARKAAARIHSRGLFTHIEKALDAAAFDREGKGAGERVVLLLTDGVVDVSKKPGESEESRRRILELQLPALQEAGFTVHTVALSRNADLELLKQIALATGGWYELAEDAETLNRIFLRMFEQSARVDTLPLKDNRFQVDGSVKEMTLLVFRAEGSEPAALHTPDGKVLTARDAGRALRWTSERGYDLITVEQPRPGEWWIEAEIDPDNRVLVVTDLKLQTTEPPSHLLAGEGLEFSLWLSEKGKPINRRDFLELVRASLENVPEQGEANRHELDLGEDNRFSLGHPLSPSPGRYQLVARASAGTFERERRLSIEVHPAPATAKVEPLETEQGQSFRAVVTPEQGLLQAGSLEVTGLLSAPGGEERQVTFAPEGEQRVARLEGLPPGVHRLTVTLAGKTARGRPFRVELEPLSFGEAPQPPEEPAAPPEEEPEPASGQPAGETPEPVDWTRAGVQALVVNLLILVPLGGGLLYWRRRRRAQPEPEESP
ncbi:MAG: VWA domain-containing protein [Gammaproteobacteria bacterium]|nr:MAG: VWA domain-containing protein [Gammaproteobacteria bacterium]